jgi:hypothetical protein
MKGCAFWGWPSSPRPTPTTPTLLEHAFNHAVHELVGADLVVWGGGGVGVGAWWWVCRTKFLEVEGTRGTWILALWLRLHEVVDIRVVWVMGAQGLVGVALFVGPKATPVDHPGMDSLYRLIGCIRRLAYSPNSIFLNAVICFIRGYSLT